MTGLDQNQSFMSQSLFRDNWGQFRSAVWFTLGCSEPSFYLGRICFCMRPPGRVTGSLVQEGKKIYHLCCLSSSVGLGYLLWAVQLHGQNFKTCMAFHRLMVVIEIKIENYWFFKWDANPTMNLLQLFFAPIQTSHYLCIWEFPITERVVRLCGRKSWESQLLNIHQLYHVPYPVLSTLSVRETVKEMLFIQLMLL